MESEHGDDPRYSFISIPVWDENEVSNFEYEHPDRYTTEKIRDIKNTIDSADFECLFMQHGVEKEGLAFASDKLKYYNGVLPDGEPDNIVFHAFEYGGEVNLQGDMTVGHTLYVKKDAVLNLNGYTLRNHSGNKATDLIVVNEGATLTINGGGYLVAESGNDGYTVIAEGTVIINGGTFEAGVDAAGEANALVYARGNGKVYVNGGVFNNAHNSAFVLNKKDADRATTVIEVRGGEFFNFNPENNLAEGPGTNFVPAGYKSDQSGTNEYTVSQN
jgi:hypothetical protein